MNPVFPYRNLHHYLEVHGLLDATEQAVKDAKKKYKKLYQRYYRSKSKKHQVNVLLSDDDFTFLKEKANTFNLKKPTQYLLHLIQGDRDGKNTPPNFLIDLEIGILRSIDGLGKMMKAKPKTRAKLIGIYQDLEELLLILMQ